MLCSSPLPSTAERETFLAAIPTETTPGERQLLFNTFLHEWDGQGAVVEIGPFLGGTTRAIAWAMSFNPQIAPNAVLHTFDRFDCYYSAEALRSTIEPMVQNGTFTASQADDLCREADFERLFNAVHAGHDYARFIRLHNSPLPDLPHEVASSTSLDLLEPDAPFGALFIDGCKSWASTHYAMKFLLPRTRVGAPVIFQDYGWYTCFWISFATHALADCLELVEHVDATYRFRLTRPITAAEVAQRFATTPQAQGEQFFQAASRALFEAASRRKDLRGELIAQLHLIAALATIGKKPAAAQILQRLNVRRYAADAALIRGCIKSPTYLPGSRAILW